jgi:hypothetical protein
MILQALKNNWLSLIMIAFIVSLGVGVRYYLLEKNFTNIDDIGVAQIINERNELFKNVNDRYETIWKQKVLNGEKGNLIQFLGKSLNELNLLKHSYFISRYWLDVLHAVPSTWTYPPGQFYLTNILVQSDQSYLQAKFWGRLPSFISGTLSLLLLIFLFVKLYGLREGLSLSVVATSILSLSWENIIYSAQMQSYAAGNISVLSLFLLLLYLFRRPPLKLLSWFFVGMLFAIPILLQYQALFFVFPAAISIWFFIKYRFFIREQVRIFLAAISGFLFIFLIFIYPYLKDNLGRGVNANKGLDGVFLLSPDWQNGFLAALKEIIQFVFKIFPEVIGSVFSPTMFNLTIVNLIGWMLIILCAVGIRSMLQSDKDKKILAVFTIGSLFVYFLALLFQILPLSPSRHSIALVSLLLIFIPEGLIVIFKSKMTIGGLKAVSLIFSIIWLFLFIPNIEEIVHNRTDLFEEDKLLEQLENDNVDLIIILDNSHQLYLMPSILKKYPTFDGNLYLGSEFYKDSIENPNYRKEYSPTFQKERLAALAKNFGYIDNIFFIKRALNIAVLSGDTCWIFNDIKSQIRFFSTRYGFEYDANLVNKNSLCLKKEVASEYSNRTPHSVNLFSYNLLEIY